MSDTPSRSKRSLFVRIFVILLIVGVVTGLAGTSIFFFLKYRAAIQQTAEGEQSQLLEQVGKLMKLPEGIPQIATVTDKDKLTDQGFFKLAENGDKVLLFVESQRAILYRPALNKIIDVAPIIPTQSPTPVATASATIVKKASITLYNGTPTVGVTQKVADRLTKALSDITVSSRENAAKLDYEKSVIIDLTGKNTDIANTIAKEIGAEVVTSIPEGEKKPNTDLLIIIGSEYE